MWQNSSFYTYFPSLRSGLLRLYAWVIPAACCLLACQQPEQRFIGEVEQLDPALDAILARDARAEIIGEGFEWSEGPLWVAEQNMLLFSDIPHNRIYRWTEAKGTEPYLEPSGYTGASSRKGELGSNGLLLNQQGRLVLCQHGDRRIARMDAPLDAPKPVFSTLADNYNGKKFDSPNDAVYRSNGDLFFTDPPYGLEGYINDSTKAAPYQGVYKLSTDGTVSLLTDSIKRPNGIILVNGEKSLVVANSEGPVLGWYAFDLNDQDSLVNPRMFYDATEAGKKDKGGPDGLKVNSRGIVFATGPGGIWIFNKDAKVLGKLRIPEACSNVALSADEKTLFITADMYLLRVKLR